MELHAAHAGGLLAGMGYAYVLRGKTERKRGAQAAPAHREMDTETATPCTDSLDQLLDKIRRSGFNSLTAVERARLIKISSNLQNRRHEPQSETLVGKYSRDWSS